MNEWAIRQAKGDDIAFIYSTWLNSYRTDSYLRNNCTKYIYFKEYPKVVDLILQRSITLVACLRDDKRVMLGYLVFEEPEICHYAFTKESFRRLGVMKSLWDAAQLVPMSEATTTHKTRCSESTLEYYKMNYNPFLLFERGPNGKAEKEYESGTGTS